MSGEIQSGMSWVDGTAPIMGEGWVQIGGSQGVKIHWDKLSKADQDLVIQYMLSSQYPVLVPPQETVLTTSSQMSGVTSIQVDQGRHNIITGMLEGWLKSIQVQADLNKKAEEKRAIERLSETYGTYRNSVDPNQDPNFGLFAVGMIIVGTGIHQALLPSVASGSVPFNPVANMADKTLLPIMGDMRAELGLIGAIYAAGLQYFTVAQIASLAVGSKAKPADSAFAEGYARNVMGLVDNPTFNSYLMAVVTRGLKKSEISESNIAELSAMVKMILLASALTMLYKNEAGKMLSEEFAGMLKGTIAFKESDIKFRLVTMINSNLADMSPDLKARALSSLLEYFDTDPSIDSLGDPAKVFAGLYATLPRGDLGG